MPEEAGSRQCSAYSVPRWRALPAREQLDLGRSGNRVTLNTLLAVFKVGEMTLQALDLFGQRGLIRIHSRNSFAERNCQLGIVPLNVDTSGQGDRHQENRSKSGD